MLQFHNSFRTCPSCQKTFVPNLSTVTMNVVLADCSRNYVFDTQDCFDKKINDLKTNMQSDGVLSATLEYIQKISEFPVSWRVILKPTVLHAEML